MKLVIYLVFYILIWCTYIKKRGAHHKKTNRTTTKRMEKIYKP